jgi:hypothetical protein
VWNLKLKLTSTKSTTTPDNSIGFTFSIFFFDGCLNDVLSDPSAISDFGYYIAYTGLHTIPTPTF